MKKAVLFLVIVGAGGAYYRYIYVPAKRQRAAVEVAYVVPDKLPVLDTTAVIRRDLATYHSGQAVRVEARIGEWAKLELPGGQSGWVKQKDLIGGAAYDQGQELIKRLEGQQAQAQGHTNEAVNLHLGPSRGTLKLGEFNAGQRVEIYDRRRVARSGESGARGRPSIQDVWYLVSGGGRAGWVLGRFVDLDIPSGLSAYAQGVNMVAWLTLDTVNDGGREVPQYLAADRIGVENFDFNHIRVFTWWVKRHKYVTAYVESGVDGYFPITVTHNGNVPNFRLRLVDDQGGKFQKVYGLYDTIVRPLGTVDGWDSTAMPTPPKRVRRARRRLRRAR
ncbi:MAG: hypothetical protein ACRD18_09605 [Terriglobia bacterium]